MISDDFECGKNHLLNDAHVRGRPNDAEVDPVGFWPWMASLGYYDEGGQWSHQCGATLISHNHFLTAAHCLNKT